MSNNTVSLQGWLTLRRDHVREARVNGTVSLVVDADMTTGKPYLGERHAVVLEGRQAEMALALLEAYRAETLTVQANVRGTLRTFWERGKPCAAVAVRYVEFLGEPRKRESAHAEA
ncbi:MAG TPA: hypothetical protein ENJ54_00050 [Chloroflexi bacterium]|nr:hypothetical protein [Chloroflexota bacterium]